MPIGTPTSVGTHIFNSGTSLSFAGSAAISAGALVGVVLYSEGAATLTTPTSVSDGTNVYGRIPGSPTTASGNGFNSFTDVWYITNAAAVASPTFAINNATGYSTYTVATFQCTGANGGADISMQNASSLGSTGGSLSVPSGTLAVADEILFGTIGWIAGTTVPTLSPGAGFTMLSTVTDNANATFGLAYDIVSSTASTTFNPSWSGGGGAPKVQQATLSSFKITSTTTFVSLYNMPMLGM